MPSFWTRLTSSPVVVVPVESELIIQNLDLIVNKMKSDYVNKLVVLVIHGAIKSNDFDRIKFLESQKNNQTVLYFGQLMKFF